jgi:hypothetical protein
MADDRVVGLGMQAEREEGRQWGQQNDDAMFHCLRYIRERRGAPQQGAFHGTCQTVTRVAWWLGMFLASALG